MLDFTNIKTRNEKEIMSIFSSMSAPKLRTVLSNNKNVIEDFRSELSLGLSREEAAKKALEPHKFGFNGNTEQKIIMMNWLINKG